MTIHIHTIDEKKHRAFLKEERHDPFTHERIKPGDRIIFCAGKCQCAFLFDSWTAMGGKHCGQTQTLKEFPQTNKKPLKFNKKSTNYSSGSIKKQYNSSFKSSHTTHQSRHYLWIPLLLIIGITILWKFQHSTELTEKNSNTEINVKQEPVIPYEPVRIITGAGVKLRKNPRWNSRRVDTLQIGTIVRPLVDDYIDEEYWYLVNTPTGKIGWVSDKYTMLINFNKREQVYVEVAKNKLNGNISFGGMVDLYHFLNRVINEVNQVEIAAELKLLRLLALQRSLETIPPHKQYKPRYLTWINEQTTNIVYNDSTEFWSVKKELFQQLYNEYSYLPISNRILRETEKIFTINE